MSVNPAIANGLCGSIARKIFVFSGEKCILFKIIKKINLVNKSVTLNQLSSKLIYTMPPKRKQAAASQEVSTAKSSKEKAVVEAPSRPKRNRAVTSYNEDYTDEPPKFTKTKSKNTSEAKEKKVAKSKNKNDDDDEPEISDSNDSKKKVEKQEIDEEGAENIDVKVKSARGRKKKVEKQEEIEEDFEEEEVEVKPTKGRKKKVEKQEEVDEEVEDEEEVEVEVKATKGRKKKVAKQDEDEIEEKPKKNGKEAAKKSVPAPPKNKATTDYDQINFDDCIRKNEDGKEWNFKISNWNVDGIRAWINKGGLDFIQHEKPDIFCLQETKCSEDKLPDEAKEVEGYKVYWVSSEKDGYAGVGLYSKIEPISVLYGLDDEDHDNEGRVITAEFDKFYVISVYVPNSGRGLVTLPKRLKWNEAFRKFVADLDKKKPVIVCGDMNVSHLEIDLTNPKTNTKNAGFTKEEREGMTEFLSDGYVDTFRKLYPDKTQAYTFWTYMSNCRAKNVGWRLDYFIVSERFMDNICDNIIRNEVFGSDHCPLTLFLNI